MRIKQLVAALSKNAEYVLPHLYPEGTVEDGMFKCNVVSNGISKEIHISLKSPFTGSWIDETTKRRFDLLNLWSIRYNIPFSAAMKQAAEFLKACSSEIEPNSNLLDNFSQPVSEIQAATHFFNLLVRRENGYHSPWLQTQNFLFFNLHEMTHWHLPSQYYQYIIGQTILDLISKGAKICFVNTNLNALSFIRNLCTQALGMPNYSHEQIRMAEEWLHNKLYFLQLSDYSNLDKLFQLLTQSHQVKKADVFFIGWLEHIFLNPDMQISFLNRLRNFANNHGVHIHIISKNGSMVDINYFENILGINKPKKLNDDEGDYLVLRYNTSSNPGQIKLWLEHSSMSLLDFPGDKPVSYANKQCLLKC